MLVDFVFKSFFDLEMRNVFKIDFLRNPNRTIKKLKYLVFPKLAFTVTFSNLNFSN